MTTKTAAGATRSGAAGGRPGALELLQHRIASIGSWSRPCRGPRSAAPQRPGLGESRIRTVVVGTVKGLFVLDQLGADPNSADRGRRGPFLAGWESTTVAIEPRDGRFELLLD